MPPGREGKIVSGRFIFLLNLSQKHFGQSLNRFNEDGDSLVMDGLLC